MHKWFNEVASSSTKTVDVLTLVTLVRDFYQSPAPQIMESYQEYPLHSEPPYDIGTLLNLCFKCQSQCQDLRDKVYGLKSIVRGEHWRTLTPDYSLTIPQVYVSVFDRKGNPLTS
jgi:hypothetical protein